MNKVINNKKSKDLSATGKKCYDNADMSNRGMGSAAERPEPDYPIRASKGRNLN